jgi:hypothetical protein
LCSVMSRVVIDTFTATWSHADGLAISFKASNLVLAG